MSRKPILAANWKMHKTVGEALTFVEALLPLVRGAEGVESVIAPPFTALDRVGEALAGSGVKLRGDINPEELASVLKELERLGVSPCSHTSE